MNDYWSLNVGNCGSAKAPVWTRDLWGTNADGTEGPQFHLLNPPHCWVQNMTGAEDPVAPYPSDAAGCTYEEDRFTNFTVAHILGHSMADGPLLAFHSSHSIPSPLEVVSDAFDRFSSIDYHDRRAYHAMVYNVDRAIGRIVDALHSRANMFENTLLIMSSDNGGPIYMQAASDDLAPPLMGSSLISAATHGFISH